MGVLVYSGQRLLGSHRIPYLIW